MRWGRYAIGCACILLLGGDAALAQGAATNPPTREERHQALGIGGGGRIPADPRQSEGASSQDQFDVRNYLISLNFDDVARTVNGSVTVTAASTVDGLTHIELNLRSNMVVGTVAAGLSPLSFTHQNHLLGITLPAAYDEGEVFTLTVSYSGSPTSGGLGTFGWNKLVIGGNGQMVWSLSEPDGARNWWPCKDRPDDKAQVEERWTVRGDWVATGNGRLLGVDVIQPGNRKRYTWKSDHPLTTYLVSVAATNYVSFSHSYTPLAGGSMPIDYYVYPEDLSDAQVSFSATANMLHHFAETFGEYPFVAEKYGMSAFPFSGAMEHSTNTSYGYQLINGNNFYDFVNAHEIAHQWWGDSVSPETWADIWLNEGFASYGEALWTEHLGGANAYRNYILSQFHHDDFDGTLYDPNQLFGTTVYDKGAMVMHMLRGVMGDTAFFQGLRLWYETRADGVGNTAQFQANEESVHGGALDWFFDEWVYGTGMPEYEYGFTTADLGNGTYRTYVRVEQLQAGPVFVMPIDLALVAGPQVYRQTVWNDAPVQDFVLDSSFDPVSLRFDDGDWILKSSASLTVLPDADADGVPDGVDNCGAVANPTQSDLDLDAVGDGCDADDDGDSIPDTADCAPADAEQGEPAEVASLHVGIDGLSWTPAARADSYDVSRGSLSGLSRGYGACLITGIAALSHPDAATPAPGQGFAYLVRGVDAGCGGPGPAGFDSSGAPRSFPCP